MRRIWLALAACLALVLAGGTAATAAPRVPAGDAPPGFWWGTDSFPVAVPGSAPYSMPFLGGAYGGYIGMTGNWAYWLGCSGQEHFIAYSAANAAQAHTNFVDLPPGRRPTARTGSWAARAWTRTGTGRPAEATAWGARQAARALADIANGRGIDYPVVWDGHRDCPASGPPPTMAGTPCTPRRAAGGEAAATSRRAIDRADFNGFFGYITAHSKYQAGCLLRRRGLEFDLRQQQRQPGQPGLHPAHLRVDLRAGDHQLRQRPDRLLPEVGRRARSSSAASDPLERHALMWQWSGGGGVTNGIGGFNGDLDQIDGARQG